MDPCLDFHSHTNFSDGVLTPEELVAEALKRGLSYLAVTDHDQTGGVLPAQKAARGTSLEVIAGVEMSSMLEECTVHILGLFVDVNHEGFQNYLQKMTQARLHRGKKMIDQLVQAGLNLSFEDVLKVSQGGQEGKVSIGRPHVAQVLIDRGFVQTRQEAFDRYLTQGKPGYVPYEKAKPQEAIYWIHQARGLAFLAHPKLIRKQNLIAPIIEMGLDGLEVIHPEHSPNDIDQLDRLCTKKNLLRSGGSDFHGANLERKGVLGQMGVPLNFLSAMKAALNDR
jgi:hypothetical protein